MIASFSKQKIIGFLILINILIFIYYSYNINTAPSDIELNYNRLDFSFREFLINEKINTDIHQPNKFESLDNDHSYTNFYYNISTKFPNDLTIDRGNHEYSIIRGYDEDYGLTISLNVIPTKTNSKEEMEAVHEAFQKSPLKLMNASMGGQFEDFLKNQISENTGSTFSNFIIREKIIRQTNFLIYKYKYTELVDNTPIEFFMTTYQTILWGHTFTFNYSIPTSFYDEKYLENILLRTNFLKPIRKSSNTE